MNNSNIKEKLEHIIAQIIEREHTIVERAEPNDSAEQNIINAVKEYWIDNNFYTADEIANRFAIPPQYATYLQSYSRIDQNRRWRILYPWKSVISDTKYWYRYFSDEKERYQAKDKYPMMMIYLGGWSDKHWYFMSCDKAHHFGKIYEAYDTDFYDIPRIHEEQWDDFLTFLEGEF